MKRTSLLSMPFAALLILCAATAASAMYHPTLGRFVQRDPGPEGTAVPLRIGQRGLGGQYADGMNLFEYCAGGATGARDPLGLGQTVRIGCILGKDKDKVDNIIRESPNLDAKPRNASEFYDALWNKYQDCMQKSQKPTRAEKHCECCIEHLIRYGHSTAALGGKEGFDKLRPQQVVDLMNIFCVKATITELGCFAFRYGEPKEYKYHVDNASLLARNGGTYEGYVGMPGYLGTGSEGYPDVKPPEAEKALTQVQINPGEDAASLKRKFFEKDENQIGK
ncbi:MAG: hypothetical protein IMZ44_07360 [Planctomycetes bacterium]|nr:hypothetical protein [Planctomycetota bacterium]